MSIKYDNLNDLSLLVIEDDAEDFFLLQKKLQESGFKKRDIDRVTSLKEAFLKASDKSYDLVMLDLNIDDSVGLQTFESFHHEHSELPVIVMSGNNDATIAGLAAKQGAQDYVFKQDIPHTNLLQTIDYAINRNDLVLEANKHSEFKSSFLASMSHEIRTPLNGILGLVDVLSRSKNLDDEELRMVKTISNCGQKLVSLTSDLLDFSKIESGKIEVRNEAFHVGDVMGYVFDLFEHQARIKNLVLKAEKPDGLFDFCVGDPERIRQVLSNLVSNAIKYTKSGEIKMKLKVSEAHQDQKTFLFEVVDSGEGVSDELQPKLFEQYEQKNVAGNSLRSSGLGLAISKGFVEQLGGKIGYKPSHGGGSIFWFELPMVVAQGDSHKKENMNTQSKQSTPNAHSNAQKYRILVVDDDIVNRQVVTKMLDVMGHQHVIAEDGVQALSHWEQDHFDLILMDCRMPNMGGVEASQKIRESSSENSNIPIIALTANAYPEDKRQCKEAGMNAFLTKPIELDVLAETIDSTLKVVASTNPSFDGVKGKILGIPVLENKSLEQLAHLDSDDAKGGFVNELIDMFMQQAPQMVSSIEKSLQTNDQKGLEHYAHKLKGFSRNLGVVKLAKVCELIEREPQGFLKEPHGDVLKLMNDCFHEAKEELLHSWYI